MGHDERNGIYRECLSYYMAMFGSMDVAAQATWFFVNDEAEVVSFFVGPGESVEQASARHRIKLTAMADALAVLRGDDPHSASQVDDLRRIAAMHGCNRV